jgi:hypothetical protein
MRLLFQPTFCIYTQGRQTHGSFRRIVNALVLADAATMGARSFAVRGRFFGILAFLPLHFAASRTNGIHQHMVKATFASPGMGQMTEVGIRSTPTEQENLYQYLALPHIEIIQT